MKLHPFLALPLAWAGLTSCAQTPPAIALPAETSESARLASELRNLIGPARCSSDAECRTVPVGAKPCGGPAGYLAWSTSAGVDAERLQATAARQREAHRREVEASGLRSNCSMAKDPGASCVSGRCELKPAVPAAR